MIVETVQGSGFRGLTSYLMQGRRGEHRTERVAWTATRNLIVDEDLAVKVMRDTASLSTRCKKPVYHCVVSFAPEDRPSRELMEKIVDDLLSGLGVSDHQVLVVCHRDTRNPHVHVVLNRVHPVHGRAWNARNDYKKIEHILRRLESVYGLRSVPGRHSDATFGRGKADLLAIAERHRPHAKVALVAPPEWLPEATERSSGPPTRNTLPSGEPKVEIDELTLEQKIVLLQRRRHQKSR